MKELMLIIKKYNEGHPDKNNKSSLKNVDVYIQPVLPQYFKRSDPRYYEAKRLMQKYIDHIDGINT